MWNQPYLETCCRSALHRLQGMGLARQRDDRRFEATPAGLDRHATEILPRRA